MFVGLLSLYGTANKTKKTKHNSDETMGTDGQLRITLAAKEVIIVVHRKDTSIMIKPGEKSWAGNRVAFRAVTYGKRRNF